MSLWHKQIVCRSVIVGSLTYALEVVGLQDKDVEMLDREQVRLARKILGADALRDIGRPKLVQKPNGMIKREAELVDMGRLLEYRRARWLRRACGNEQLKGEPFLPLAAICGLFSWEKADGRTQQQHLMEKQ